ncbi:MAG: hypothetical protein ACE5HW_05795 [Candidatus Methanofastidiosia archaeon]
MINVDFYLHSKYSMGTSVKTNIPAKVEQVRLKDLDVVRTRECFQPI